MLKTNKTLRLIILMSVIGYSDCAYAQSDSGQPADAPKPNQIDGTCGQDAQIHYRVDRRSRATFTKQGLQAFVAVFETAAARGVENATIRALNSNQVIPTPNTDDCCPAEPSPDGEDKPSPNTSDCCLTTAECLAVLLSKNGATPGTAATPSTWPFQRYLWLLLLAALGSGIALTVAKRLGWFTSRSDLEILRTGQKDLAVKLEETGSRIDLALNALTARLKELETHLEDTLAKSHAETQALFKTELQQHSQKIADRLQKTDESLVEIRIRSAACHGELKQLLSCISQNVDRQHNRLDALIDRIAELSAKLTTITVGKPGSSPPDLTVLLSHFRDLEQRIEVMVKNICKYPGGPIGPPPDSLNITGAEPVTFGQSASASEDEAMKKPNREP